MSPQESTASVPAVTSVIEGGVAVVTMNRPEQRNALNTDLKAALRDTLAAVAADDTVRAVVLTGAGKAFCVGQDLGEHATLLDRDQSTALDTVEEHYNPITTSLATMPKPVIAAVNGTCVGAGLGFALACDLRVFAAGATLGTAFLGIGLTCDSGVSATLAQAVGVARARELVLLATPFTPEQAGQWGISGAIVPPEEVVGAARELADRLAAGPTLAYAASKRLLGEATSRPLLETLVAEGVEQRALGLSSDHLGAVKSFLAKQTPTFEGR